MEFKDNLETKPLQVSHLRDDKLKTRKLKRSIEGQRELVIYLLDSTPGLVKNTIML